MKSIPVLIAFPQSSARKDGWGNLARLSAQGAEILTLIQLPAGEPIFLTFDVLGEIFEAVPAETRRRAADKDGYCRVDISFNSQDTRSRLARTLLGALARSS